MKNSTVQTSIILLIGAILGALISAGLLYSPIKPLWPMASIVALLCILIAWWQTPCIRAVLKTSVTTNSRETTTKKQLRFPCFKRWLIRLLGYGVVVLLVFIGIEIWLVRQPVVMNMGFYEVVEEKIETEKKQPLPFHYALKKTVWQFGIVPKPTFVTIPVGEFTMGSDNGRDNERPVHQVTLKQAFMMSRDEITFEQYDYYVWSMQQYSEQHLNKSMQKNSKTTLSVINYPDDEGWGRNSRPVINVSWEDAQGYVNWLSKKKQQRCRLPSEAEWEYAARAGTTTDYFWGNKVGNNNAVCRGCGSEWDGKKTAPVGSFTANAWGLNDMHGNIWEWVQDRYQGNYQDAPADGSAWEKASSGGRVLRGGSWFFVTSSLRASDRSFNSSDYRNYYVGFRVVCALPFSSGD